MFNLLVFDFNSFERTNTEHYCLHKLHVITATVHQTNMSMKVACESFSTYKEDIIKERAEIDVRFAQVKSVIEALRQSQMEKENTIRDLQKHIQVVCSSINFQRRLCNLLNT